MEKMTLEAIRHSGDEAPMNIRRGLVRIWVVLTALLLIPLGIGIHQEWLRVNELHEVEIKGHRFKISEAAFDQLPPWEHYQVLSRIAWLNGLENPYDNA